MSDKIYPKGLFVNAPRENAPEFVMGSISIKVADLHEWLNINQGLANDSGYINLDILEGRENWYCTVNTWKPKQKNDPAPRKEYYTPDGGDDIPEIDNSDVPF